MKYIKYILSIILCSSFFIAHAQVKHHTVCVIETEIGNIRIELYGGNAPVTVANFLQYVDAKLFDSSNFYRVVRPDNQPNNSVKIEVIQGGITDSVKEKPSIVLETTKQTGLRHENGTISMARGEPNSATCHFFICINDQPALDFGGNRNKDGQGFAAFGKVLEGMDVVKKIQAMNDNGKQYLLKPVKILRIRRE